MGPTIVSVTVVPSQSLCDLGVYIDADLTMRTQVQRIASRIRCTAPSTQHLLLRTDVRVLLASLCIRSESAGLL